MLRYILKRLLLLIPVLLAVIVLVFTLLYLAPGDAALMQLKDNYTEEAYIQLKHNMGLDDPYPVQLGRYLYNLIFKLDFGRSWTTGASVADELAERIPRTLILGTIGIIISAVFGVLLGVNAAVHQNGWQDYSSTVLSLIFASTPGFFFALVMVIIFAYKLDLLPPSGMGGPEFWILPILSTAFGGIASQARQTRSSMLEVINSDYVVMAKAKGLKKRDIIFKHALPNAMIPIITVIGASFANVLGGGLIIETVFRIPGVGYYLVSGCNSQDYNVVLACTIVISVFFSVVMLLTDIVMAAIDPRIKSQFASGRRVKG